MLISNPNPRSPEWSAYDGEAQTLRSYVQECHDKTRHTARETVNELFLPLAWPGMYPIVWGVVDAGATLCPRCAKRALLIDRETVYCDIYYEGPVQVCDDCGCTLESAYGDPDHPE